MLKRFKFYNKKGAQTDGQAQSMAINLEVWIEDEKTCETILDGIEGIQNKKQAHLRDHS